MTDLDKYREDLTKLTDEQIVDKIDQSRVNLASYDRTYAELREAGADPMSVTLESSQEARVQLQLAERELARRYQGDFGSCPMSWPEEDDEPGESK